VHGILVEDSEISISREITFQGFQFKTEAIRTISNGNDAEIRKPGLRTNRREFRHRDRNFIARKLIRPALDDWKLCVDSRLGVIFCVIGHNPENYIQENRKPSGASYTRGPFP